MRATTSGLLLAAALLAVSVDGAAQSAPASDARWQAWIGCWQPTIGPGPQAVCVIPAGGTAVEIATVEGGKVSSRERVDASGEARAATREACAGTERARFSPDARRVYLTSTHACDGVTFGSTGVLAIAPTGEWIDVRGVSVAGGPADVRARRYRALADESVLPRALADEVRAVVASRPMVRGGVRANASAALVPAHVAEAAREVDAGVVEALLIERGEGFALDAKQLVTLDDAGVPGRVIDVMVALSYPDRFAIDVASRDAAERPLAVAPRTGVTDTIRGIDMGLERRLRYCREGRLPYSYCDDYLGHGGGPYSYSPYSYSPYGYSPYGFGGDPFGVGAGFGYYGRRPPVIVVTPPGTPAVEGRAVKGKGYTRRGGSSSGDGGTAEPRSSTSSERSTTRSRGESSGSKDKSSERSGGSRETGRTAKPRNP